MEVRILAEAQVLHPPRWALVDYGPLPNGGSLLAVWRYDREGRPVSLHAPNRAWVERVLRELLPGEQGVEWTHPRLLARSRGGMAWWRPAWPAAMHFALPALADLSGQVFPQPPLVFVRVGPKVHLFALKEDRRPGPDTPLCLAPYFNYHGGRRGWVCWGNGPVPEEGERNNPEAWEAAFFAGAFSHVGENPLRRGSLPQLWRKLAGRKRFPTGRLKEAGLTLGEAVALLLGGGA